MLTGIAILYLLIGVFLALFKRGKYVLPYILFLNIYSAWLTDFVFPLEQGDHNIFDGVSKYFTYFCFVLYFFRRRTKDMDFSLLYVFILTAVYFILIYVLRGAGPVVGLKYAVSTFGSVLFFLVLFILTPSKKQVRSLVKWNLLIQLVIGGFQFLGLFHFHMNIGESFVGTDFITGSFTRNNIYSEVISLLLILQCIFDYKDYGRLSLKSLVIIVFVISIVIGTGVRTALLADVIVLAWMFYTYNKEKPFFKVKFVVGICIIGMLTFSVFKLANQDAMIRDRDTGDSIERQLNGLREISDRDNLELSTIGLSIILWSYFIQNPVIGPGLYFTSTSGYGGIVAEDTANSTDVSILLFMCEVGLIGVFLFILLYGVALLRYNNSKGPFVVFLYLLMISVTDAGFWGYSYVIYLYISIYYDNWQSLQIKKSSLAAKTSFQKDVQLV